MPMLTEVRGYLNNIDRLLTFPGAEVSDHFNAIRAAIEKAVELQDTRKGLAQEALDQAVRDGDIHNLLERLNTANAAAIADFESYAILNKAQAAGLGALKVEYDATAGSNYKAIADEFNTTADLLRKASQSVDLNISDSRDLLPLSKKAQDAWLAALGHAGRLEELATIMPSAATAAGLRSQDESLNGMELALPLTVDTRGLHVRRLWEAWDNESSHHLGRWGALLDLGADITARPLDQISTYSKPLPKEMRQQRQGIGYIQFEVDPHDADYEPASETGLKGVAQMTHAN